MRRRSTNAQQRAQQALFGGLALVLALAPACEAFPEPSPRARAQAEGAAEPTGPATATDAPAPTQPPPTGAGQHGADENGAEQPRAERREPDRSATGSVAIPPLTPGAGLEDERNTIAVFEAAGPATVFVTQSQLVRNRYTLRVDQIPAGTGSGFIWDREGHVVTNFHVVAGGDSFAVTLWDGRSVPATLVGGDPKRDIAVLALDPAALAAGAGSPAAPAGQPGVELTPVSLPDPKQPLVVGQKALAIGNPFGLDHTLTTGVISALEREVVGYGGVTIRDMIQTDASINPGNSGGPLLDSAGQLIGMNTMIYSKTGGSAGIGFAVPVATIRRLVPQIIQYGKPRRAGLGIEILSDTIAKRAGLRGVIIDRVEQGGPAAIAGLRGLTRQRGQIGLGDVIVGIDELPIKNYDDLFNALDRYEPGDTVNVKVTRGGEVFAIETTLALLDG